MVALAGAESLLSRLSNPMKQLEVEEPSESNFSF
jgi:hypothetical protein